MVSKQVKNLTDCDKKSIEGFTPVCSYDELREKVGRRFIIDEVEIAVFKLDGKIFAVSNICPHQHTAMIYDGFIENGCVVCPAHGWTFDLLTGKTLEGNKGLDVYETKVIADQVFVKAVKRELKW